MQVGIQLHRFAIDDKMVEEKSQFTQIVTSDAHHGDSQSTDLVTIKYARVQPNSPEFMTVHEGNNQASLFYDSWNFNSPFMHYRVWTSNCRQSVSSLHAQAL